MNNGAVAGFAIVAVFLFVAAVLSIITGNSLAGVHLLDMALAAGLCSFALSDAAL